jgi:hypothetical protein
MHSTEPPITQDPAGQATTQQPDADRSARRRVGLRRTSLGICLMLIAQLILGVAVNLYAHVPAADQGHGLGTALGRALTSAPATLAAHAALGTLLLVAAVNVLARALRARHKLAIAASVTGLAAIAGAAVSGASFVSDSRAGASMAMAFLTGVALLCYMGNLFAVPPGPAAASQGGRDD